MAYAELGNVRLHYVEEGEGDLVLLLHGFPDFSKSWEAQLPALAEAGFRAVAPDLRGYNLSSKPRRVGAYDVDLLVEDIRGLIEALDMRRAHVVGHDWGGVIAWYFAMRFPEYLDKLAVVNTPHPGHIPMGWLRDPKQFLKSWYIYVFQLPSFPERRLSDDDFARLRRIYESQNRAFTSDDIEEYVEAARRTGDLRGPLNYYRAIFRSNPFRLRSRNRKIESRVLVLWGDQDVGLETSVSEPPRSLVPKAEAVHFPDAGHWLHREKTLEVNAVLTGFFTSSA